MTPQSVRDAIESHALEEYPRECCGLIVNGEYRRCRNIAPQPLEGFEIHAEDYAGAEDTGRIEAVVHSHPGGIAKPSHHDLTACEAAGVPLWVIVSLGAQADGSTAIENWCEFSPSGYEAPLYGCEFSHGTNDCYGFIRRYYKQELGVSLPDFPRSGEWWDDGKSDLYTQNFEAARFYTLPNGTEPEPGDVLLMKIRSRNNVPNHAVVYLGDGYMGHHMWGQLSRKDQYSRYRPYITHTLRYRESEQSIKLEQSASTVI